MSDNQNWQEQLQQRAGELIARRLNNFADELQTVQAALNDICQRLPMTSASVTAEEATGLREQVEQVKNSAVQAVESGYQTKLEQARQETEARLRQEYETQVHDLQAQLETAHQQSSSLGSGLGMAAAGAAGFAVSGLNTGAPEGYDSLRVAIEEIDAQRQQADVLSALVRHSAQFSPRAVFFVIKSGSAIGWKATGFMNGLNDDSVRSLNLPIAANSLLNEAIVTLRTASAKNVQPGVLGNFSSGEVSNAIAAPLVIRGKAAAILYSEANAKGKPINLDAIETLMQVTSMAIELLPVRRSQPVAAQTAQPAPVAAPAPPAPAPVPVVMVQPEPVQAQTATFAYKVESDEAPSIAPPVITPLPTIPAVEVPEAVKVETAQVGKPVAAPAVNPQNDDEVRAHNDARRFARLLVSEIKLYNEHKVSEGRRSHDLYERLKEDIDRSRQMYEKRVSASVSSKFDYFYDELLHTLGEGDAAKLGSGCPGPTVPVS